MAVAHLTDHSLGHVCLGPMLATWRVAAWSCLARRCTSSVDGSSVNSSKRCGRELGRLVVGSDLLCGGGGCGGVVGVDGGVSGDEGGEVGGGGVVGDEGGGGEGDFSCLARLRCCLRFWLLLLKEGVL
jgi:hypothetical protein